MLTSSVSSNPSLVPDIDKPINGLLRRAVGQMCLNWERTRGWDRRRTWLGRTLIMIHRVWPQFQLTRKDGGFAMSGIPREHLRAELSRSFLNDATCKKWQDRRSGLTTHQEDYFLQLVAYAEAHNKTYDTQIKTGRIFICTQNNEYQTFDIDDYDNWVGKWYAKLEQYYKLIL